MKQTRHVKTKLTAAILLALGSASVQADLMEYGLGNNNFTMLSGDGGRVGGTNDVVAMWDGTFNTSVESAVVNMTIESTTPFFGVQWFAHDVQVFGPGTYTFEACPGPMDPVTFKAADGSSLCSVDATPQTMTVGPGQVGAHMLFDWNSSVNIDVVNVWDVNAIWGFGPNDGTTSSMLESAGTSCLGFGKDADITSPACVDFYATEWMFTSVDASGTGVPGAGMVDGPFRGFAANFNIRPQIIPVPAAVWLMASGCLGLLGWARRRR